MNNITTWRWGKDGEMLNAVEMMIEIMGNVGYSVSGPILKPKVQVKCQDFKSASCESLQLSGQQNTRNTKYKKTFTSTIMESYISIGGRWMDMKFLFKKIPMLPITSAKLYFFFSNCEVHLSKGVVEHWNWDAGGRNEVWRSYMRWRGQVHSSQSHWSQS